MHKITAKSVCLEIHGILGELDKSTLLDEIPGRCAAEVAEFRFWAKGKMGYFRAPTGVSALFESMSKSSILMFLCQLSSETRGRKAQFLTICGIAGDDTGSGRRVGELFPVDGVEVSPVGSGIVVC
jgi:hypothetical protein